MLQGVIRYCWYPSDYYQNRLLVFQKYDKIFLFVSICFKFYYFSIVYSICYALYK